MAERLTKRQKRQQALASARLTAPDGMQPRFSHGDIIYIPVKARGEEPVRGSDLTRRQIDVIKEHENEVRSQRREATRYGFDPD